MSDPLLKASNISKTFDGLKAVDDFSFAILEGSIVGLIGPNGAGKSTVFNMLTGFLKPDRGQISLQGKDLLRLAPYQVARAGVARTFQDLRLIREVPVLENVLLARPCQSGEHLLAAVARRKMIRSQESQNIDKAIEFLEFVGLRERQSDLAETLSYGQQKLLTLACCLATEAPLLLLDEPVSGIHPDMINKILELLSQLAMQDKTILFIEHNIEAVLLVADFVIVMDAGRKIAEGAPSVIKGNTSILEAYLE